MPTKTKRCAHENCKNKPAKANGKGVKIKPHEEIIGYCKTCEKYYCIDCRLPETHGCNNKIVISEDEKKKQADALRCCTNKTIKI